MFIRPIQNIVYACLCVLLTISSTILCSASEPQPVFTIDSLFEQYHIEPIYLRMIADSQEEHTLESVRQLEFLPIDQFPVPNQRKPGSVYWIKIILENRLPVPIERWLLVESDYANGFLIKSNGKIQMARSGLMLPHQEKTFQAEKRREANYLPIRLDPTQKATLYIRNEFPGYRPPIQEINQMVSTQHVALQNLSAGKKVNFWNGFFQAILLILFLYCLFYSIYAKELFAVYLTIYCVLFSILFLIADGYLYQFTFLSEFPYFTHTLSLILVNTCIVFNLLVKRIK